MRMGQMCVKENKFLILTLYNNFIRTYCYLVLVSPVVDVNCFAMNYTYSYMLWFVDVWQKA